MNSLVSMILAVIMLFSMAGGITPTEGSVSFDAKISMDAEAVMTLAGGAAGNAADAQQNMKVIGDILNAITLKGVANQDTVELGLFAGDDVLLSLGVKNTEEGSTFASSLLSSYTVFTSTQLREMLKQQMMSSITQNGSNVDFQALAAQLQKLDKEQMWKDSEAFSDSIIQTVSERKGEAETGEFTVDGMTFIAKAPVNMTYTEFMEVIINGMKDLLAKESYQPLLQVFGQGTDLSAEFDKALEQLKNQPEEEKPEMQLTVYTDDAGNIYCVSDMTQTVTAAEGETAKEQKTCFGFGKVDGLRKSHANVAMDKQTMDMYAFSREDGYQDIQASIVSDAATAEIKANADLGGSMEVKANIKAQGLDADLIMKTETMEGERTAFTLDMYMNGAEKPVISVTGSAGKGGEPVSVFEGEDITVIPLEKLMDTEDTTASSQLQMSMMGGILKAITTLTKNVPEDTADWLKAQIAAMMNPGSKTEAPQGAPADGN